MYCSRIVGHVKCDYSSPSDRDCYIRVFHPLGGLSLVSLPFEKLLFLPFSFFLLLLLFFTEHFFSPRLVLETSRVENPLRGGSLILKIGGQWCVNLRENTRTLEGFEA